jgi:hypothetical protein
MSRVDRRIRAKLERTTRHPRPHRNEEFLRKKEDSFDKSMLANASPEVREFVTRYGLQALADSSRLFKSMYALPTGSGIFCGSCKLYELPVVHVATFDEEPVELPEGTRICLHCPICDARLHPDFHFAEEDD